MLSIHHELWNLVKVLNEKDVLYAVCGGLALAIHGYPRATLDIDLLGLRGSAGNILAVGHALGFTMRAKPMKFAGGSVLIDRISKPDPESDDLLSLDVLSLADDLENKLKIETRRWNEVNISTVSRESLIILKRLRASAQDVADIEKLS